MINLIDFCSKEDPAFAAGSMREPFSDEKYTYATNGSYIIRVPFEYEEEEGIEVGDHYLSKALLLKLRNLPLFAIRKYPTAAMHGGAAHFVFFGGEGMLMPYLRKLD